ncbi:MAG: Jag N-terminal domain-containing protein [Candidatus Omnitrophota bacterium]
MSDTNKGKEVTHAKEFKGKTIEEAIEKALAELSLPKEKIKISILTEGQRGLFGMKGAKQAKIRVTVIE